MDPGRLDARVQLDRELLGDLLGVAAQGQALLVVGVVGVLDGDVAYGASVWVATNSRKSSTSNVACAVSSTFQTTTAASSIGLP